jgi:hypothetical protein
MAACVGTAGTVDWAGAVDAVGAVGATGALDVTVVAGAVDALGAAGVAAESVARDAVRAGLELTSAAFLSVSFPLQFATTRPVASAVAPTSASARLVIFQGFFQLSFNISTALL